MKIWLDDNLDNPDVPVRHTPEGWDGAKNFREFKSLIERAKETGENIGAIDFDNDLGVGEDGKLEMEGREI